MGDPVPIFRVYQFGVFTLDARTGELTHNGNKTPLREQPLKLLLALLEQPGELVTREELVTRLWPSRTFVDVDRGLNKAVNHLREVLGDSAEQPVFVEALPRKGYRFVAPVSNDTREVEPALAPPDEKPPRPSLRHWLAFSGLAVSALVLVAVTNLGGARSWLTRRLTLLEDCYEHRCSSMATLKAEPDFEALQQEPRFQELLRKMGLL